MSEPAQRRVSVVVGPTPHLVLLLVAHIMLCGVNHFHVPLLFLIVHRTQLTLVRKHHDGVHMFHQVYSRGRADERVHRALGCLHTIEWSDVISVPEAISDQFWCLFPALVDEVQAGLCELIVN